MRKKIKFMELIEQEREFNMIAIPKVQDKGEVVKFLTEIDSEIMEVKKIPFETKAFLGGDLINVSSQDTVVKVTRTHKINAPKQWDYLSEYKGTKVGKGQSVLVYARPGGGKTSTLSHLLKVASNRSTAIGVLFGERRDDVETLFNPHEIDSCMSTKLQVEKLENTLFLVLKDTHSGLDVTLGIDSLTRIVELLTSEHRDSLMQSGGISFEVKYFVSRIFKLAGKSSNSAGRLTIIGTALDSRNNNTWRAILTELKSSANAEIRPDVDKSMSFTRRKIEGKTITKLFGIELQAV